MAPKPCLQPGCDQDAFIIKRGLCKRHYSQAYAAGLIVPRVKYVTRKGACKVEGCSKPRSGRGMCGSHYLRSSAEPCAFEGCPNVSASVRSRGYCLSHRKQAEKGGPLRPLAWQCRTPDRICSATRACRREVTTNPKRWCAIHYCG